MARKQGSHADITRPRVRDAALRLFAQHGYAAVSMRQIAAEVGVQAGAIYNYTPDKQALLADLMRDHLEELLAAWDSVPTEAGAVARLRRFVRFHLDFHLPRPDQVFIAYMELRHLDSANFAGVEALRRRYEDALEAILRAGLAEGVFAVRDTRVAAMALIALLTGLGNWYRAGGRLPLDEIAAIYWDLVRKAVLA